MPEVELEVELRHIEPGDKFSGFSIGDQKYLPLKTFLHKKAKDLHEKNLARTYGVFLANGNRKIIGYITLVCGEIQIDENADSLVDDAQFDYRHYPAIKIARLAIDSGYRDRGIGEQLVHFSFAVAKDIVCPSVGCRFVVVDAKKDAVDFYERKCGFTILDTEVNRTREEPVMFLDLHKLKKNEPSAF